MTTTEQHEDWSVVIRRVAARQHAEIMAEISAKQEAAERQRKADDLVAQRAAAAARTAAAEPPPAQPRRAVDLAAAEVEALSMAEFIEWRQRCATERAGERSDFFSEVAGAIGKR